MGLFASRETGLRWFGVVWRWFGANMAGLRNILGVKKWFGVV